MAVDDRWNCSACGRPAFRHRNALGEWVPCEKGVQQVREYQRGPYGELLINRKPLPPEEDI